MQALAAAKRERNAREAGKAAKCASIAHMKLGDATASRRYAQESLAWYQAAESKAEDPEFAAIETDKARWSLIHCLIHEKMFKAAERELARIEMVRDWPQTYRIKARLELARNRPRAALKQIEAAIDASGNDPGHLFSDRVLQAEACLALRRFAAAAGHATEALRLGRRIAWPVGEAERILGQALASSGQPCRAVRHYRAAAMESFSLAVRRPERRAAYLALHREAFDSWVKALLKAGRVTAAWEAAQFSQSANLRDMLSGSALPWHMVRRGIRDREEKLRCEVERLQARGASERQLAGLLAQRSEMLDQALDALPFAYAIKPQGVSLVGARRRLGRGEALVSFYSWDDRTAFWVVGRHGMKTGFLPIGRRDNKLIETMHAFMAGVANEDFAAWFIDHEVRDLFAPVLNAIAALAQKTVTILPSPMLWTMPLHVLPVAGGMRLGTRYACRYLPNASLLRCHCRGDGGKALIVGDPEGNLPYAREEAVEVGRLLGAKPLCTRAARRGAVLKGLGRARIVHLACHGTWDHVNPDISGLEMADGRLGVYDFLGRDLSHVRLMSLMGCDTGRVSVTGNELSGFSLMALAAGCRTVVEAVVPIQDAATLEFARGFYAALRRGVTPAEAHRQVMDGLAASGSSMAHYASIRVIG